MKNTKYLFQEQLAKSKAFVRKYGRKLDIELLSFVLDNGSSENVIKELEKFQNPDSGFGHGLEPDLRTPLSSNIATTYAFQYFERLNSLLIPNCIKKALVFYENSYDSMHQRWIPIPKDASKFPHAVWWKYNRDKYLADIEWGNPTVEIIGYLLKYQNSFDQNELELLKQKALLRLYSSTELELHELLCYQRFANSLGDNDKESALNKIIELVQTQVEKDSRKWSGYVSRPLYFVDSPGSPLYHLLSVEIDEELDYLITSLDEKGGWHPNWGWGQYQEVWQQVKNEIAAMVTTKNLLTLKTFGRII